MVGSASPDTDCADWIGRSETRIGRLTPEGAGMLGAAVMHERAARYDLSEGAVMPHLWHWAAFNNTCP